MPTKRRDLIFIWPYIEWGGAQIYCIAMMKLARESWNVTVVLPRTSSPDLIKMLEPLGVNLEYIDSALDLASAGTIARKIQVRLARTRTELTILRRLRKFHREKSVLHVDLAPWQSSVFLSFLALAGWRVFFTMHNFFPEMSQWREKLFRFRMQFVSRLPRFRIFTSNQDAKDKLKEWVSPVIWEEIPVTYTCVDPIGVKVVESENVKSEQLRRHHGIPTNKYVVLTIGQFIDRKGRWTLLDAAARIARQDNDIVFVWVTPTLPSEEDFGRVRSFNLGEKFRLILSEALGPDRLSVLRFFKAADCFVLPSFIEGLPIAVLEAMGLGIPTISTNVFAIPEAVIHERTGLLADAGDSTSLAKSILRLKNAPELADRLASAGRDHVLENFDERNASRIALKAFDESLMR